MTVMPKSLISLTVASGDLLRWYSRFVGIFFLEIFMQGLTFGYTETDFPGITPD